MLLRRPPISHLHIVLQYLHDKGSGIGLTWMRSCSCWRALDMVELTILTHLLTRPLPEDFLARAWRHFSCHSSAAATTASTLLLAAACTSISLPLTAIASTSAKYGFSPADEFQLDTRLKDQSSANFALVSFKIGGVTFNWGRAQTAISFGSTAQ